MATRTERRQRRSDFSQSGTGKYQTYSHCQGCFDEDFIVRDEAEWVCEHCFRAAEAERLIATKPRAERGFAWLAILLVLGAVAADYATLVTYTPAIHVGVFELPVSSMATVPTAMVIAFGTWMWAAGLRRGGIDSLWLKLAQAVGGLVGLGYLGLFAVALATALFV